MLVSLKGMIEEHESCLVHHSTLNKTPPPVKRNSPLNPNQNLPAVLIALVTPVEKAAAPTRAYSLGRNLANPPVCAPPPSPPGTEHITSPASRPNTPPSRNTGWNSPTGRGSVTLTAVAMNLYLYQLIDC